MSDTRETALVPLVAKPPFGAPCNGCGLCCSLEVCQVGQAVFETTAAPCPGLRREGGRFFCRAVEMSDAIGGEDARLLRFHMGIGLGCDADD